MFGVIFPMEINSLTLAQLKLKNHIHEKTIVNIIKLITPTLKKYKVNPPEINELMGKNARWSCGVKGISIKFTKENKPELIKASTTIIRDIVEASVNRKYLLEGDKNNKEKYTIIKSIIEELKVKDIYKPQKTIKNQFKGFNYETVSKHGTQIKSINRQSVKVLLELDNDLQLILKAFNISLNKLHETQSTIKEGHNRNNGKVIAIKVIDRTYTQIFYTALHEIAHSKEFNHGIGFRKVLGQLILWCYHYRYPTALYSKEILRMAKMDTKYSPIIS